MYEQDSATLTAISIELEPEPELQPVPGPETGRELPHIQPDDTVLNVPVSGPMPLD